MDINLSWLVLDGDTEENIPK